MKSFLWRGRANQRNSHETSPECLERRYNLWWGNFKLPTPQLILSTHSTTLIILARMRRRSVLAFVIVTDPLEEQKDFHFSMKLQVCFASTQQRLLYHLKPSSILYQLGLYCVTTVRSPAQASKVDRPKADYLNGVRRSR